MNFRRETVKPGTHPAGVGVRRTNREPAPAGWESEGQTGNPPRRVGSPKDKPGTRLRD
jgi:hypothetical protein